MTRQRSSSFGCGFRGGMQDRGDESSYDSSNGKCPLPRLAWFVLLVDDLDEAYWHGFVIILAVDVNMAGFGWNGAWIHPSAWG